MPERKARITGRRPVAHLETVTVFRDRPDLSAAQLVTALEEKHDAHTLYSVTGVLRDASSGGVGLGFEGQQPLAQKLLRTEERYLLQFTLAFQDISGKLEPYLTSDGAQKHLLVRAVCRWDQMSDGVSRVGFEFLPGNPEPVLQFLAERLGTRR